MFQRVSCWLWGHEMWNSREGAWFCMRCLKNRDLARGSSLSGFGDETSVLQAFQEISAERRRRSTLRWTRLPARLVARARRRTAGEPALRTRWPA